MEDDGAAISKWVNKPAKDLRFPSTGDAIMCFDMGLILEGENRLLYIVCELGNRHRRKECASRVLLVCSLVSGYER